MKLEETRSGETTFQEVPLTSTPIIPIPEPDVPKTLPKPNIPYPSRSNYQKLCEKATKQMEKFFQIFQDFHFDISFADALLLMPKIVSTIKREHKSYASFHLEEAFPTRTFPPHTDDSRDLGGIDPITVLKESPMTSSSSGVLSDELALLDLFPPRNEDVDFKVNLREIELLLNQDPSTVFSPKITIDLNHERFINESALVCLPPPGDDDNEKTIPLNKQIPPSFAITSFLPTSEPEHSFIMGDEHLSTIPETESNEVIKSSVEKIVPNPSESEDTFD
ncbi:hypothetical protein Tco_0349507 [Tanacetum coccineum]